MRRVELILMILTLVGQAVTLGVYKGIRPNECGIVGELRSFLLTLVPNVILAFWACSMWMNY